MYAFIIQKIRLPGVDLVFYVENPPPADCQKIAPFNGLLPAEPARLRQVHGGTVHLLEREEDIVGAHMSFGDGFITTMADVPVAVSTADCIPTIIVDGESRFMGLLHCGWRGVAAGIIENAVNSMVNELGADVSNLICAMGPGILADEYEVGPEVASRFESNTSFRDDGKFYLDLPGEIAARLIARGIPESSISFPALSTFGEKWLPSYRRDGDAAGRMSTIAWL